MLAAFLLSVVITSGAVGASSDLTHQGTWTAGLSYPARLAPAPGGGLYVTDPPMKQVVQLDAAGAVVAAYPVTQGPVGIAVHADGRVFISRQDGVIGVYDAAFAPLGTVNPAPFTLGGPNDLAMHPVGNELYAVDSASHSVLVFAESAPGVWTLARSWGLEGTSLGEFTSPQAIAIDPGLDHVVVTDTDNFRVQVFDTDGIMLFKFGYRVLFLPTEDVAWMARLEGAGVDGCGNIYLSDALMGTVRVFSSAGGELDTAHLPSVGYGTGAGQLRVPGDLLIDGSQLYIANTNNAAVEVFAVACTAAAATASAESTGRGAIKKLSVERPMNTEDSRMTMRQRIRWNAPDNPADMVSWIESGEYNPDFDLNRDGVVAMNDLEIAVTQFGAGTVEDFLAMHSNTASHPALEPPHILDLPDRCGRCHSMDGAPEGGILTAAGQENLCQSCHSAGKIADKKWIGPSSRQNSHAWGVAVDAGVSQGLAPDSDLAIHLDGNNIRCGTCHNPHESVNEKNYIRLGPLYEQLMVTVTGLVPPAPRPMTVMNPTLCGECHTDIVEQWKVAGHAEETAEAFVHYDWAASNRATCRKCHSGYGYIDADNGIADAQQRGDLRVVDCLVCHSTHGESQDGFLLRKFSTVTVPGPLTLTNTGSSAACMACHNGRNAIADSGFTPHYLLGGVMLAGVNGITTFRGTAYTVVSSQHTQLMSDNGLTCATCHMADSPPPGNPGAGKVGGHTFNLQVHDEDDPDHGFQNVANACAVCHTGLTTLNRPAGGDYDGDGTVEGVQDETEGLLAVVVAAIEATGAVQLLDAQGQPTFPYWKVAACVGGTSAGATCTANSGCPGGGTCVTVINPPSDRPIVEDAIWNWEFVDNSGDRGVKNTAYAVGLLQVAYKGLTGGGVPNASYRYTPAP